MMRKMICTCAGTKAMPSTWAVRWLARAALWLYSKLDEVLVLSVVSPFKTQPLKPIFLNVTSFSQLPLLLPLLLLLLRGVSCSCVCEGRGCLEPYAPSSECRANPKTPKNSRCPDPQRYSTCSRPKGLIDPLFPMLSLLVHKKRDKLCICCPVRTTNAANVK